MLRARSVFACTNTSLALEAIIYLPQAFGGLGVKNPLITLNLACDISSDPSEIIQEYLDVESRYYEAALSNWSALKPEHISTKLSAVFHNNDESITAALGEDCAFGTFMTKASLTKHREYALFPHLHLTLLRDVIPVPTSPPFFKDRRAPYLVGLYNTLLEEPIDNIIASERVSDEVRNCGSMKYWDHLDAYDRWVLQMYGDECFERYGTLDVWLEEYVPRICMILARGGRWDGGDDDSSDMTSVI
jgi:hypothetical protein